MEMRQLGAWFILFLLLVVPFINWQIGALFWMCAFLVYVLQQVFRGNPFSLAPKQEGAEEDEDEGEDVEEDGNGSEEQENHKS